MGIYAIDHVQLAMPAGEEARALRGEGRWSGRRTALEREDQREALRARGDTLAGGEPGLGGMQPGDLDIGLGRVRADDRSAEPGADLQADR